MISLSLTSEDLLATPAVLKCGYPEVALAMELRIRNGRWKTPENDDKCFFDLGVVTSMFCISPRDDRPSHSSHRRRAREHDMTRSKMQAHPTEISPIPRLKPNANIRRGLDMGSATETPLGCRALVCPPSRVGWQGCY